MPREEIYAITGIQFMPINTLNQLFAAKTQRPRLLSAADRLLMIPDLFNYWLAGRALCEFTIASTTQMVNAAERVWAVDLMERLGLPSRLPAELVEPGSIIGPLLPGRVIVGLAGGHARSSLRPRTTRPRLSRRFARARTRRS